MFRAAQHGKAAQKMRYLFYRKMKNFTTVFCKKASFGRPFFAFFEIYFEKSENPTNIIQKNLGKKENFPDKQKSCRTTSPQRGNIPKRMRAVR